MQKHKSAEVGSECREGYVCQKLLKSDNVWPIYSQRQKGCFLAITVCICTMFRLNVSNYRHWHCDNTDVLDLPISSTGSWCGSPGTASAENKSIWVHQATHRTMLLRLCRPGKCSVCPRSAWTAADLSTSSQRLSPSNFHDDPAVNRIPCT